MRNLRLICTATGLLALLYRPEALVAGPSTVWAKFPPAPIPVGVPVSVQTDGGTVLDVTVQTGGTQGLSPADIDTFGVAETNLEYTDLYNLLIFDGGGQTTVPTTLTFSNIHVVPGHKRGLLMAGDFAAASSPITVTSSISGRVASWSVVGIPFAGPQGNTASVAWDPNAGQFTSSATTGIDGRYIVIDLGNLSTDGTITESLNLLLDDGAYFGIGEELVGQLDVPASPAATTVTLAMPRPNPARDGVSLEFSLPTPGRVRLAVYDVAGRGLTVLADGDFTSGSHVVRWDLHDAAGVRVAPGLVFVRLETPLVTRTRRLLVER